MVQQEKPKCLVPLWIFRWPAQAFVAGACTLIFGVLGVMLLAAAGGMSETYVDYVAGDTGKEFNLDDPIEGPALIWYELPEVLMNQKRFVESKDDFIVGNTIFKYSCKDAEFRDVGWRRCPDSFGSETCARWSLCPGSGCPEDIALSDPILRRLANVSEFRPCGLVSLSMFTDRYRLVRLEDDSEIQLEQGSVSLESQDEAFESKVVPLPDGGGAGREFKVDGIPSWLTRERDFFEHFKVWYRQPASPHIRNLWATVPGGLRAGQYRLEILENAAVWTEAWEVPYKRVTIAEAQALGSKGACGVLGGICLAFACAQALMTCAFLVTPRLVPASA